MQLPEGPFLAVYTRKTKTCVHTKTCTHTFIAALLTTAQPGKEDECLSAGSHRVIYSYNGILLSNKKLQTDKTTTWMNLFMKSEAQPDTKSTQYLIPFIWNSRTDKSNLEWQKAEQCCLGLGKGWGLTEKGCTGAFWNDGNVLFPDCSGGCVCVWICQNSSNGTLKMCAFCCM